MGFDFTDYELLELCSFQTDDRKVSLLFGQSYYEALEKLNNIEMKDPYSTYYLVKYSENCYEIRAYCEDARLA